MWLVSPHMLGLPPAPQANRHADEAGSPWPSVVRYTAPAGIAYEAFNVVAKICTRSHLTTSELEAQERALSYFFPGAKSRAAAGTRDPPKLQVNRPRAAPRVVSFRWEDLLLEQSKAGDAATYPTVSASSLLLDSMTSEPRPAVTDRTAEPNLAATEGSCSPVTGLTRRTATLM